MKWFSFNSILSLLLVLIPVVRSNGIDGWFPCNPLTTENTDHLFGAAECAEVQVPLCYPDVCSSNQTISVFVKRILKKYGRTKNIPALWMLQGGPGATSIRLEPPMLELAIGGEFDVYTMDHRGVGRSNRLQCYAAEAETSGSPAGTSIAPTELIPCAEDIAIQIGNHFEAFSVTSAAYDIKTLVERFNTKFNQNVYIYGVSYGTYLVERYLQIAPNQATGIILDGVVLQQGRRNEALGYSTWDQQVDLIAREFLRRCSMDDLCSSKIGPDPIHTLQNLHVLLDRGYCSEMGLTSATFKSVLEGVLRSQDDRVLIPAIIFRLRRCSSSDVLVLQEFLKRRESSVGEPQSPTDPSDSSMLEFLMKASELWLAPTPTMKTLERWFNSSLMGIGPALYSDLYAYCLLSGEVNPTCTHVRLKFGISNVSRSFVYRKDKYFNKTADLSASNVSLLVLNGLLDLQTPDRYARVQFKNMRVGHGKKKLILFKDSAHGTIINTPVVQGGMTCSLQIISSFIIVGGNLSAIDESCIQDIKESTLNISSDLSVKSFGVIDPFDGETFVADKEEPSLQSTNNLFVSTLVFFAVCFIAVSSIFLNVVFAFKWMYRTTTPMHRSPIRRTSYGAINTA